MAYELKDGQGNLFKNERKTEERFPDYQGEIKLNNQVFRLSAWIKQGQKGKWMSLSVRPKEGSNHNTGNQNQPTVNRTPTPTQPTLPSDGYDDDVPF